MIRSLDELVDKVTHAKRRYRIAVAWGQDQSTLGALARASAAGFAEPILVGNKDETVKAANLANADTDGFKFIESASEKSASDMAVKMTREGESDIVMKGLVNTDIFLKSVMHKELGLLPVGKVMSYVCAIKVPAYNKLIFLADPAVLPFPDLNQKVAMVNYSVEMARRFGIDKPKVALIGASEKVSRHFENSIDYSVICKMADRGQIKNCIVDGPLDLFLACDKESVVTKGVPTPINGEADVLIFPGLESSNPFYKSLVLFGGGELAGILCGPEKPVVVMSRSDSENTKLYCIALACLMASK